MTIPIRLNVLKDGHIILRIGDAVRVEVLVEGTLLVAAYQGDDPVPTMEYATATGMSQPPEKTYPLPWLKPRAEPEVDLEPILGEIPHEPEASLPSLPHVPVPEPKLPMHMPEAKAPVTALPRLSKKDMALEYARIATRRSDIKRMDLLLRLVGRAERIAGPIFTPLNERAPFEPQKELFFAELRQWRTKRQKLKPQRIRLGFEAPPGHTPWNYALSRIKPLAVPDSPEKLLYRYAEYNRAMGSNHAVPPNMSIKEANDYLVSLVQAWRDKLSEEFLASRGKAPEQATLRGLFNGNVRISK